MRIAITGASGLLGRALIDAGLPNHQIVATTHSTYVAPNPSIETVTLDLTDSDSIKQFTDSANPDLVIHSAALTDVDLCEREPGVAYALNSEATRMLAALVENSPARIIYISTDYVFDGAAGPYAETDTPNPINVYGKSKLEGEEAVLALGDRAAVVRSASFLGHCGPSRPTFAERLMETMRKHPPLKAACDQFSNITPVDELATGIMRLAESGASGVWHIAHPRLLSRYDFAVMLAELSNLDPSTVERVKYASLQRAAARPLRGGLISEKATNTLLLTFRPLERSITAFLQSH